MEEGKFIRTYEYSFRKKVLIKLSSLDHIMFMGRIWSEHVVPELISKISTINKK